MCHITSNHIHLIVYVKDDSETIPKSLQLLAGRTGQEYNKRKKRMGAFWEDRYHATAVQTGEHMLRCLLYVDMNMIRAGVVTHPAQWPYSGYNEVQRPRRKNVLIDYETLSRLFGFNHFDEFQSAHGKWVVSVLADNKTQRQECWTRSIATGSRSYVEAVKTQIGGLAIGRQIRQNEECFELRETQPSYNAKFKIEKHDIEGENRWIGNV